MSDYKIITDSTADLPQSLADELGLAIIPYQFTMEGKNYLNYLDHREIPSKAFYNCLREGKTASTSLVTAQRYIETFEPFLEQGTDILYMCLSTGLSSSYSQCLMAAETLTEQYPERKLIMIDSLCASMGQGMLAYYAAKEKEKGRSLDETAEFVRQLIPDLCHWFTVEDLNHLHRGGRVSGASAFVGTLLSIKPILHVDHEGKLIPVAKVRGRVNSLENIAERLEKTMMPPKDQIVFIGHCDTYDDAKKLANMVEQRVGARQFVINDIGPVIGAHLGPGSITLFFVGTPR